MTAQSEAQFSTVPDEPKPPNPKSQTKVESSHSIYGEALLICCIVATLYFAWHVFAMGSGGVLYHGY